MIPLPRPAPAIFLALLALLPACAPMEKREVTGALTYRPRIALPPEAEVEVSAQGALGTRLGENRKATGGAQVPLPFTLSIPPGVSGTLQAVIHVQGQPRWLAEDLGFEAGSQPLDLGTVVLQPATPLDFATRFSCGDTPADFGVLDERATLRVEDRKIPMRQEKAASGARYVAEGGEDTVFWSKGDAAMLRLQGRDLPECTRADRPPPYRASGNEPGWHVDVGAQRVQVVTDYGARTRSAPRPPIQTRAGGYRLDLPGIPATLTLEETLCRDSATGMPHPHRAVLELPGQRLQGCGGDPMALLTGGPWRIEDVAGGGSIDRSQIRITFDPRGRVTGSTGCNRFFGPYTLTGEGLTLGPLATTMMACPQALMDQERRVLQALEAVRRFDRDATGALRLMGESGDTPLLTARRP
ncbi:META domain-containing protein [Ectothiorhodospira mobilis]|uniref:META domain-containing protein n=1 Tax=Ectothiorhodospira mobilis TaxID=195064 RepID=UPI001EE790DB|nr:META domain-containing protein [Ectothiorhodospira mobilis]MCG5535226.1 META domain-containing protein [Ectothiorhodospira mobilis]